MTRLCRSERGQWVSCRLPTPDDGWSAARRRSWPPCRAARSPSRKPANATSLPRRSFAPGSAPMRRMAFPACAPPAFSNTAARARRDPADRAAADHLPPSWPGSGTHTIVSSPARCSFARLDASRRSVLIRSPGRFGIRDGATTTQSCPPRRQLALDAVTARSCLITEPQLHPLLAKLANQPIQNRRCVGDAAIVPHLAPPPAFCDRRDDRVLVNIKPDIRDTIPQDPSPTHEARHRPIRCNPRYLHTGRRVAPSSRGHVV